MFKPRPEEDEQCNEISHRPDGETIHLRLGRRRRKGPGQLVNAAKGGLAARWDRSGTLLLNRSWSSTITASGKVPYSLMAVMVLLSCEVERTVRESLVRGMLGIK